MPNRPLFRTLLITLVIGLSVELIFFASSATTPAGATLLLASIGAVILIGTVAALMLGDTAPQVSAGPKPPPTERLPDYQLQALDALCRLPQYRRVDETSAIDYRTGMLIGPCGCAAGERHLAVSLGGHPLLGFVSPESIGQFIAVQTAYAQPARAAEETP